MVKEFTTTSFNRIDEIVLLRDYLQTKTPQTVSLEQCFLKAVAIYNLLEEMKKGVVKFYYRKMDGTIREAVGTLQDVEGMIRGAVRQPNYSVQVYYDLIAEEFRCFKKENLVMNLTATVW